MALVNFTEDEHLEVLNHSCAPHLQQAACHLFPDAKFWVGPVVAEDFIMIWILRSYFDR